MKEEYFGLDSIDRDADIFLRGLTDLRDRHLQRFRWRQGRAALLILDMQDYFLVGSSHAFVPSARAIIPRIRRLQQAFLERGLPVVQTRHVNTPADSGQMAGWWSELLTADNPLSAIAGELTDSRTTVLTKAQYDAFFNTGLADLLKSQGTKHVVITGVMTHLCCETTARAAFMMGLEVLFVVDGTATYNRAFHSATLLNLAHGFAIPVLTRELLALLDRYDSGT